MSSMPTQTSENREIVSRAISEVLSDGNFAALADLYAEEFEEHGGASGDLRGRAEFRAWIEQIHAGFPDFEAVEEFSICEGDLVASRVTYTGTHDGEFLGIPATGAPAETTGITINRVRDGKIVESWPETDMLRVLRQVGVVETPEE
jgi:steroid delta-isomerase-like uncharacterized protein